MNKSPSPSLPPVSMPTVTLNVNDDGTITVTVDETPLPPPPEPGVWRRGAFPQIIDLASNDRAFPVRVEVHENDGTAFTDIVPTIIRRTPAPDPLDPDAEADLAAEPTHEDDGKKDVAPAHVGQSETVEVTATRMGFAPGETLAVAVVTGQVEATETGDARVQLDRDLIEGLGISEVILLGRTSKALVVREIS